jgi:hypothetical protein
MVRKKCFPELLKIRDININLSGLLFGLMSDPTRYKNKGKIKRYNPYWTYYSSSYGLSQTIAVNLRIFNRHCGIKTVRKISVIPLKRGIANFCINFN